MIFEKLKNNWLQGLKLSIRDEVEIHRIWKLNDAYQLALKVEVKLA
jgi:hypothetical protein